MFEGKEAEGTFDGGSYVLDVKPDLNVEASVDAEKEFKVSNYFKVSGLAKISLTFDPIAALEEATKDSKYELIKGAVAGLKAIVRPSTGQP
jgi:hypothetical protein